MWQFVRFIMVGLLSTALNYGVFFALYQQTSLPYLSASAAGYVAGVVLGFLFNKYWTFGSTSKKHIRDIGSYLAVYTVSLILGLGLLEGQVSFLGFNPLLANLVTIGFTTITNFLGTKFFVFKK